MNKLDALHCFCIASETLNFRKTAQRLAVSPQVVSRTIAELEAVLGEPLFKRNTRQVKLTEFGQQFLPKALQFLQEGERLFASSQISEKQLQGLVRITLPPLPQNDQILFALLQALEPYPNLVIDWQVNLDKLKAVDDQIDIGLRICLAPEEDWIGLPICQLHEKIVASPALIKRLDLPKTLQDLEKQYPLSVLFNPKLKRAWKWQINSLQYLQPTNPVFISSDMFSELQSALSGRTCSQLLNILCEPYLKSGQLVELFPEVEKQTWLLYLYRPYQTSTAPRVLKVFELLKEILDKQFNERA